MKVMSKSKWKGRNVAVLASGPSLNVEDCEAVRDAGFITVAVNSAWKIAPWCDVLYAGDARYWKAFHEDIDNAKIEAKRYSKSLNAERNYGARVAKSLMKGDYNSGQMAIEFAMRNAPDMVVLLGFDGSIKNGLHFHGTHGKTPDPTKNRCKKWHPQFARIGEYYNTSIVVNCSRYTEIDVFKCRSLEDVIDSLP